MVALSSYRTSLSVLMLKTLIALLLQVWSWAAWVISGDWRGVALVSGIHVRLILSFVVFVDGIIVLVIIVSAYLGILSILSPRIQLFLACGGFVIRKLMMRVSIIPEALAFIIHRSRPFSLVHAHVNVRYIVDWASFSDDWPHSCDVLRSMMVYLRFNCLLIDQVPPRLGHESERETGYVSRIASLSFLFTVVIRHHVSPLEQSLSSRIVWCEGPWTKLSDRTALCIQKGVTKHELFTLQVLIFFRNLVPFWSLRAQSLGFESIFVLR